MVALIAYFPTVPAKLAHEQQTQVKGEITVAMGVQSTIAIIEPQPVNENDLKITEPGERLTDYRKTWTRIAIVPTDEIEIRGIKYRVHQVDDRIDEFYRAIMRKKIANVA